MHFQVIQPIDKNLNGYVFLLWNDLLQPFQYIIHSRTNGRILKSGMRPFEKFITVCIRIIPAIARPHFVDATAVVASQKRARAVLHHIIALFIQAQIGFNKSSFFHGQVSGNAPEIGRFKPGTDGFATTRTLQTMNVAEGLLMQPRQLLLRSPAFFGLHLLQKLLVFFALICRLFLPIDQDLAHHAWIAAKVSMLPI